MSNPGPASATSPNLVSPIQIANVPSRTIVPGGHFSAISAPGMGSMSLNYVPVSDGVTASRLDILMQQGFTSSATANTWGQAITMLAGIYTNQGTSLSLLSSGSTQTTFSVASNSAGNTALLQNAIRPVSCPINVSMFPGEYLVAVNYSSATSSMGTATTALGISASMYGPGALDMVTATNYVPEYTQATATSVNIFQGMGVHSVTQSAMPSSVALSDINQTGAGLLQANVALIFRNQ